MKEPGDEVKPEHDRDRGFDELLRGALAGEVGVSPSGACLDPETAAAWMENTLSADDRAAAEAHVAGCPRCQALLGAIGRTETAPDPARAWWQRRAVRWLAPAAVTAAAGLALITILPRETPRKVELQVARSESPTPSIAPSPETSGKAIVDGRERASSQPASPSMVPVQPVARPPARMDAPKETRQTAARRDAAATRAKDLGKPKSETVIAPAAPTAAPLPSVGPVVTPSAAAPPASANAMAKSNAQGRAGGVAGGAAGGRAATPAPVESLRYGLAGAITPLREVISPDPQSRWRLGSGSAIDRSTDGGRTWSAQATPSHAPLIAGSSPAPSVCWLVGKAGTVLLTVDGRTWQLLAFPEAVDLVSVTAPSADAATVTAADGRTFATADRGRTWSPRWDTEVVSKPAAAS